MPSHLGLSFYPYLNRDKPCHVIAYNCANTRMSVLKKLFPLGNYEFGKEYYAFYPMKLSRFAEEKNHQKNSIIILRVLGIQTS